MDGQNLRPPLPTVEEVAQNELAMLDVHAEAERQRALTPPKIGSAEVRKATEILRKYKDAKSSLEKKIVNDEEYWKLRQWDKTYKKGEDYRPATAWLWSCIQSRYSDAMDSYPTCNFLARQEDDKMEAKKLTSIVPVILEQNRYEETYSDVVWYLLKHGGVAQGVFWNQDKHNGLGDIEIKLVDLLNLFWEAGVKDIQDSENLFCVELVDKNQLAAQYPQTKDKITSNTIDVQDYRSTDEKKDETSKAVVVDWYYHTYVNGKKTLQYVKYVNEIVLYATENDTEVPYSTQIDEVTHIPIKVPTGEPSMAERGLYDHAMYPFVIQQLYPIEGSLCGYGLTDIGKDCQQQIDVLNKAIIDNAVFNSSPRYFSKSQGGINEDEFVDVTKPIVHVAGDIEKNLAPVQGAQLSGVYVDVLETKKEELKYVTSNQDVGNGVAPSGVTAASAIAALQETQGKNARSSNKALYRLYRDMVYQVIELIRQFYTLPRTFRIAPDILESNEEEFVSYSNEHLVAQPQIQALTGENLGMRIPEFDIEVTAEKQSPYKKMEQNELALAFFNMGFFNPQMSDQALGCLQMMDFEHKEDIMNRIKQNGTIQQLLLQYQQIALQSAQKVASLTQTPQDAMFAEQVAQGILQANQLVLSQKTESEPLANIGDTQESTHMTKARNQARESTAAE